MGSCSCGGLVSGLWKGEIVGNFVSGISDCAEIAAISSATRHFGAAKWPEQWSELTGIGALISLFSSLHPFKGRHILYIIENCKTHIDIELSFHAEKRETHWKSSTVSWQHRQYITAPSGLRTRKEKAKELHKNASHCVVHNVNFTLAFQRLACRKLSCCLFN